MLNTWICPDAGGSPCCSMDVRAEPHLIMNVSYLSMARGVKLCKPHRFVILTKECGTVHGIKTNDPVGKIKESI